MFWRPTKKIENKLWQQGYKLVAGLDEAGRGAWAGPIVAAAVILPVRFKIGGIRDSKLLSPRAREKLFVYITKNALGVGVGVVSEKIIDERGIIEANRRAFLAAVDNLAIAAEYLLVDGLKIFEHTLPADFIIRGDQKVASIAAASIIAKVTRDNILKKHHERYPEYEFAQHKGYGTKLHYEKINQYGLSQIHRKTWEPMIRMEKIGEEEENN